MWEKTYWKKKVSLFPSAIFCLRQSVAIVCFFSDTRFYLWVELKANYTEYEWFFYLCWQSSWCLQVKRQNKTFWQKVYHCILGLIKKGNNERLEMCLVFPLNTDALSLESYCVFLPVQTSFLILPFFHFSKSPPLPHPRSKTVISFFFRRTRSMNSPRKVKRENAYTGLLIHLFCTERPKGPKGFENVKTP